MKISASIYSNPDKSLREIVRVLDGCHVDYLHVDSNDDLTVFNDIGEIRPYSSTPVDLHVISSTPEAFFEGIMDEEVEMVSFQVENFKKPLEIPDSMQCTLGIAIMNNTPLSALEPYMQGSRFSFVLLMTTVPGQSGGVFDTRTYDRIREVKERYPSKRICVDGGVNAEVAASLRKHRVDYAVSGSYLVKSQRISEALMHLTSDLDRLDFCVADMMSRPMELPVLTEGDVSLESVMNTITRYKTGYCILIDSEGRLTGVVTDGDLRAELLRNIDDLNRVKVENMINRTPIKILDECRIGEAFQQIHECPKKITFLPVVDAGQRFMGAISITQLIRGSL